MKRLTVLIPSLLTLFGAMPAAAEDNPLLGTWKLKSFVREVSGTSERYNQMG
ncbi:hypothetical protein ACE103_30095 [Bradyrhizobium sp. ma5]|uniref:hypothetical protein n=1 Tax=Bradyrhizobium sp. ma5 TaxID=3344828 RepID=UPI0035D50370